MNFKILLYYILFFLVVLGCNSNQAITGVDESTNSNIIEGCMDGSACNYDSNATVSNSSCMFEDACGVCGGIATSDISCSNLLQIMLNNSIPLSGFQFDIQGVNIISSYGGIAEAAGFSVSSSSNSNRVLGFSFSGATIPPGEAILTILEITGNIQEACLENIILSDATGTSAEFIIEDCTKIIVP